MLPVFIFSGTNGIPVTAASLWDASCCLGASHLPTAPISPQPVGLYRCLRKRAAAPGEPRAAAIPQQVLVELFLGSSLHPPHFIPLSHQPELLVPPRGEEATLDTTVSGDKPRHHSGPWGRLLPHPLLQAAHVLFIT